MSVHVRLQSKNGKEFQEPIDISNLVQMALGSDDLTRNLAWSIAYNLKDEDWYNFVAKYRAGGGMDGSKKVI